MDRLRSGKVRDVYADGDDLILVASDRISVYDVVLPTDIPDKGKILTQLSLWWFGQLADVVPNHIISATDVPAEWSGRAVRCRRLTMIAVECIARGYLTGGMGHAEYASRGAISGVELPAGLVEGERFPEPIFTLTTKEAIGTHDEFMTFDEVVAREGRAVADELSRLTLEVYRRGAAVAAGRGIIIADTKLEFGRDRDGGIVLGDEVLTPDSSRFWAMDRWRPGGAQHSFDKRFVRDWLMTTGWDKTAPAPEIPDDVVDATRALYIEAYEQLTGDRWAS